jgi:hypothetical protein
MRLLAILALGLVLAAVVYFLAVGPDLLEILDNPKF